MRSLERLDKLSQIIRAAGGEILGKTKFQKIVFLAQEKGYYLGYDYNYYHYGVFSPDLEADIHLGEDFEYFKQEETDSPGSPVKIRLICDDLTENNKEYQTMFEMILPLSECKEGS